MIFLSMLAIVTILAIAVTLFLYLSPQFGGKPTAAQLVHYQNSGYYKEGIFVNPTPTFMEMGFGKLMTILGDYIKGIPNHKPNANITVQPLDSLSIVQSPDTLPRVTWFGHSAFLLETNGKNLLIDPMLGESPSPLPALGSKRYSASLPIEIEKLPQIDAVIISHDHYDHLDYGSIMQLKDKVKAFYTPLGVGAHLLAWGVDPTKIKELNWWEEVKHKEITLVATPARHFSGRGLTDRFKTFWCSWVIMLPNHRIYFSGDGGYAPHFREIGEKYGPFDFAMMECGQYDERWNEIHMMPEETIQAAIDVKANMTMPIHWGAFSLALHSWTEPIERASKKAAEMGVAIATPVIGQTFEVGTAAYPQEQWWKAFQ